MARCQSPDRYATSLQGSPLDDKRDRQLSPLGSLCDHDLHDRSSWKQGPIRLAVRTRKPSTLVHLDHHHWRMGAYSDELGALGRLCSQPHEMVRRFQNLIGMLHYF